MRAVNFQLVPRRSVPTYSGFELKASRRLDAKLSAVSKLETLPKPIALEAAEYAARHKDEVGDDGEPELLVREVARNRYNADLGQHRQKRQNQGQRKDDNCWRIEAHRRSLVELSPNPTGTAYHSHKLGG